LQIRVLLCRVLYKHRAETPALCPGTLETTSRARDYRKIQRDAKAERKATARLCSGQQEEILAGQRAHHIDLWPLAL